MNIQQIKEKINQPVLTMVRQLDEAKNPTEWVSHWDNDKRVRVVMHQDVFSKIKADKEFAGLAVKTEQVQPDDTTKKPYTRHVVITPTNIEATF